MVLAILGCFMKSNVCSEMHLLVKLKFQIHNFLFLVSGEERFFYMIELGDGSTDFIIHLQANLWLI